MSCPLFRGQATAIQHDPSFVPALCQLAHSHRFIYWQGDDHTPARLEAAERLLDQAARVQPDSGELHLERAYLFYWGKRDYESALRESANAQRALPNDPRIPYATGLMARTTSLMTTDCAIQIRRSKNDRSLDKHSVLKRK